MNGNFYLNTELLLAKIEYYKAKTKYYINLNDNIILANSKITFSTKENGSYGK